MSVLNSVWEYVNLFKALCQEVIVQTAKVEQVINLNLSWILRAQLSPRLHSLFTRIYFLALL